MATANNNLEQTIALIATANEVTQNPESVGNALKTVSMRIRGVVSDEDEDGDTVMSPAELGQKIKDITKKYDPEGLGVSIMENEDKFKSTYQILLELSEYWDVLKDTEKAYLLERISGKHRATQIAAILSNGEQLSKTYITAMEATGSAMEEFEKRTESIEYHLAQLNAAWQELATNTASAEFVNSVIDTLRGLVEGINEVGLRETLTGVVAAIGQMFWVFKASPFFEAVGQEARQSGEEITFFGKQIDMSNSKLRGLGFTTTVVSGIVKSLKGLITGLAGSFAMFAIAIVGFEAISFVADKVEKFANRIHYAQDEVDDLTTNVTKLKDELKLLQLKLEDGSITVAEQERLDILEQEIALQEYDLKLAKERWALYAQDDYKPTVVDNNGNVVQNDFTKADYNSKQAGIWGSEVLDADANIKTLYKEHDRLRKLIEERDRLLGIIEDEKSTTEEAAAARAALAEATEDLADEGMTYAYVEQRLSEISGEIVEYNNVETDARAKLSETYEALLADQKVYEQLVEMATSTDKDHYQAKLDLVNGNIELVGAMLGLNRVSDEYASEQKKQLGLYEWLQEKIFAVTSEQGVSIKQFNELKEKYPEVASVIEQYGEQSGEVWKIESSWMSTLQSAATDAFDEMMTGQIQATALSKIETEKRLADIAKEVAAWKVRSKEMKEAGGLFNNLGSWAIDTFILSHKEYELDKAAEEAEEYAEQYQQIMDLLNGLGTYAEDEEENNNGNGLNNGNGDAADVFDQYANALARVNEELERYGNAVEVVQAQLDLNQSQEERTVDLLSEEQRLYGELLAAQEAQYQIVNDTLWLQMQQLKAVQQQAQAKISAINPDIDTSNIENWTKSDIDYLLEYQLKLDDSEASQDLENFLYNMVEMGGSVHDLHMQWYDLKQTLRDTRKDELQSIIDWQNDSLEKFEDARTQTESLLELLEEVEGTEQERLNLTEGLVNSYDSQKAALLSMHETNSAKMNELGRDLNKNQDLYQMLLKQNEELEQNYLDTLKSQLDYKQQLLDLEKEYAEQLAETEIYGEQGKDKWENARQKEIDSLNDEIDAMREEAEEDNWAEQMADYEEELAEKEEELADLYKKLDNLRAQKTIQTLEEQEDGSYQWKYVEDQIAIDETLEEIADKEAEIEEHKNEMIEAEEERALEEKIALKEAEIESIENEIERRQELYDQELEMIDSTYQRERQILSQWLQDEIANWQARIIESEKGLKKYDEVNQKGWNTATENTNVALTELQSVYSTQFEAINAVIRNYEEQAMRSINNVHAAIAEAKRAAAEAERMANEGSDGSHANGLKFVESNNYIARLHYGERVLTRQEAQQYNELESDIKSGRLAAYFESAQIDTANAISTAVSSSVRSVSGSAVPTAASTSTSFVIEHLELPNVQDAKDFANVLQSWARNEFGGLAQKAKIVKAR